MCELYMHGYFLRHDQSFNPIPFVGDIHLRAFASCTINQIKWRKAYDMFEENQVIRLLMMRKEHVQSANIYNNHFIFLQIEGHREHLLTTQKWCDDICVRHITMFRKEALDSCQRRWMLSSSTIRG